MTCRTAIPKHLRYDKRPTIGKPGESWDMYIVRKIKEVVNES